MSSDDITKIIVTALGSLLVGIFLTWLKFRLDQKQKIIEYRVGVIYLLRYSAKVDQTLQIVAQTFLLTGEESDKISFSPISGVSGFAITLVNAGDEDIVDPKVEIRLDETAIILKSSTNPEPKIGYEIKTERCPVPDRIDSKIRETKTQRGTGYDGRQTQTVFDGVQAESGAGELPTGHDTRGGLPQIWHF